MTTTTQLTDSKNKQPRGLYTLFFVEIWERFGFYCVQALLVLFLSKAYGLSDTQSYDLFSAYSALIYATPIIGGYIADRLLGFRKAITLGAFLYLIGYFALATSLHSLFYPALAFLICGNGFFKSCVSSLLGSLYENNDHRRDSGFTIFYMGINIGSIMAPIICSWVATKYGWGYGFACAGIGMLLCLAIIYTRFKHLGKHGLPPEPTLLSQKSWFGVSKENLVYLGIVPVIILFCILIQQARFTIHLFELFGIAIFISLFILARRYDSIQKLKIITLIILVIFSIIFWAIYLQIFSSMVLFADRVIDRHAFGYTIPTGMLVAAESFFLVAFAPLMAMMWIKLKNKQWDLSLSGKFSLSLLILGATFLLLAISILLTGNHGQVSLFWLIISYALIACSELCISPIGLSMIIALAPANRTGMLMGVWFLAIAIGFSLGDYLADLTNIPKTMVDPMAIARIYSHEFGYFGWFAIAVGLLLLFLTPILNRMSNPKDELTLKDQTLNMNTQV